MNVTLTPQIVHRLFRTTISARTGDRSFTHGIWGECNFWRAKQILSVWGCSDICCSPSWRFWRKIDKVRFLQDVGPNRSLILSQISVDLNILLHLLKNILETRQLFSLNIGKVNLCASFWFYLFLNWKKSLFHRNNDAKGSAQILRAAYYNRVYFFCPSI